jgi:hypothetical protein
MVRDESTTDEIAVDLPRVVKLLQILFLIAASLFETSWLLESAGVANQLLFNASAGTISSPWPT